MLWINQQLATQYKLSSIRTNASFVMKPSYDTGDR